MSRVHASGVKAKRKQPAPRQAKRQEPVLFVRMTDDERAEVHRAAEMAGFRTDSEWVRQVLKKVIAGVDLSLR